MVFVGGRYKIMSIIKSVITGHVKTLKRLLK
jgi:hypothetical protein